MWIAIAAAALLLLPRSAADGGARMSDEGRARTMTLPVDATAHPEAEDAVTGWQAHDAHAGVMQVRLVGGMWPHAGKAGAVMFSLARTPLAHERLGQRAHFSAEVRVSPEIAGPGLRNWHRAHRARLILEDTSGRRQFLPNANIIDRPRATDGWLTLRGRAITPPLPVPLGFSDEGFDSTRIARIGVGVEAFNREGEVVVGAVELRNLRVSLTVDPVPTRVLPSTAAVIAGEAQRARRMSERLEQRCGLAPGAMALGVNLAWPTAKSPKGEDLQLYGRLLDGGTPWWDRLWDVGEDAVATSVRKDFHDIRETFGPGAVVRLWLFGDLRAGMTFGPDGVPTPTARARDNMRRVLRMAEEERVMLIPVLYDFSLADGVATSGPDGVWKVGEHPELITDAGKRAAFVARTEEFVRAFADAPAVLAWEPMNEPENAVAVVTPEAFADLQAVLAETVDAIHRAGGFATVGHRNGIDPLLSARGRIASDLGQAHYYPLLETRPNPTPFGADFAPLFGPLPSGWGEAQARPGHIGEQIRTAHTAGHRLLMFWSWRGHQEAADGFAVQPYADEIRQALREGAAGARRPVGRAARPKPPTP